MVPFLLTVLWGCGPPPEPAAPGAQAPVLLVTLGHTPAARMGVNGYARARTVALDQLADRGTTWLRAYTTSPETQPATTSILTGLVPASHGVWGDAEFRLSGDVHTLATRFRSTGYRTHAITGTPLTSVQTGLLQGFDAHVPVTPERFTWQDLAGPANSRDVVDAALDALEPSESPAFVWVHLTDGHPSVQIESANAAGSSGLDARLAHQDRHLGRLLDAWNRVAPNGFTAVVGVQGQVDAGKAATIGPLADDWVRVPLVIAGPGVEVGLRSDAVASSVDVAPTLLRLTGHTLDGALQGRDLRDKAADATAWTEWQAPRFAFGLAPLRAWTDATGRYIEGAQGQFHPVNGVEVAAEPAGGNLDAMSERLAAMADAFEPKRSSPSTVEPPRIRQLDALGTLWGDAHAPAGTADPRDSHEVIDTARQALRYLAQKRTTPARDEGEFLQRRLGRTALGDRVGVRALIESNQPRAAIEAQRAHYLAHPTPTNALWLGELHTRVEDWPGAQRWFDEALGGVDPSPSVAPNWAAFEGLVRATRRQGEQDKADSFLETVTSAFPAAAPVTLLRAEALLADGQHERARVLADRAIQRLPQSAWAWHAHAQCLQAAGEADAAVEDLRKAVRLDPYNPTVRRALSDLLEEIGDFEGALRLAGPLIRTFPDDEELAKHYTDLQKAALDAGRVRRPGTGYRSTTKPQGQP